MMSAVRSSYRGLDALVIAPPWRSRSVRDCRFIERMFIEFVGVDAEMLDATGPIRWIFRGETPFCLAGA